MTDRQGTVPRPRWIAPDVRSPPSTARKPFCGNGGKAADVPPARVAARKLAARTNENARLRQQLAAAATVVATLHHRRENIGRNGRSRRLVTRGRQDAAFVIVGSVGNSSPEGARRLGRRRRGSGRAGSSLLASWASLNGVPDTTDTTDTHRHLDWVSARGWPNHRLEPLGFLRFEWPSASTTRGQTLVSLFGNLEPPTGGLLLTECLGHAGRRPRVAPDLSERIVVELTLGIDLACRAAHQASLARPDGTFIWTGRPMLHQGPAELETLWAACRYD